MTLSSPLKHTKTLSPCKVDGDNIHQIQWYVCSVCVSARPCMCSVCVTCPASLLLQQSWDVYVPSDGLPVEATGEQVT